ncbi:MAG: tripartite tricarboxylate transporter substrate binding protein [Deltaproteobacteria bacterium]|nr:tripartite tricarboxylate transporter substrate binding protein [Deltaproteobacteria bacterium]
MTKSKRVTFFLVATMVVCVFSMALVPTGAGAADWPQRPVTMYIQYSAGGATDYANRALAAEMRQYLGEVVVCQNMTGAGGAIAANHVAKQPADGYAWLGAANTIVIYGVKGLSSLQWNDFYPYIAVFCPAGFVVEKNSKYKTLEDLLAAIKANPNKMAFGSPGIGSGAHCLGEALLNNQNLKAKHVPYKGGRDAIRAVLNGEVAFASITMGDGVDYLKSGDLRALTIGDMTPMKVEGYGTIPSIADQVPEMKSLVPAYMVAFGPMIKRNTPPAIVNKITDAFLKVVKSDKYKSMVEDRGLKVAGLYGEEADRWFSKNETGRPWILYNLGIAKKSPTEFGIPKLEDWKWLGYEKLGVKEWPAN